MFERFTEKLRRVVFFSRYEASQFGSPYIESEHLLLGLLREDGQRHLSPSQVEEIRREIEARTSVRERPITSTDLPLSNESKRTLAYACEEADAAGDKHIGTEHLVIALLRGEGSFSAELLRKYGFELLQLRSELGSSHFDASHAGAGGGSVGAGRRRPPTVEFVCGEQTITSGRLFGPPPRIGEHVLLTRDGADHRYRVVDVCYRYELPREFVPVVPPGAPGPPPLPPLLATNVIVQLESDPR